MEYAFSAIGGVSAKIYDDIVDNNLEVSDTVKEALKGVQWIILALLSIHDFNFTLFFYIINFLNYLNNNEAFSLPYEHSLLYVYPIFLLFNYYTIQAFNYIDIIPILLCLLSGAIESYIFSEDISYKKLISRAVACIGAIILLFIGLSKFMNKVIIYGLFYGITSVIFQGLLISGLVKRNESIGATAEGEEGGEGKKIPNPSNT
jgi:drug/metabolite transporter (DMT)-like permease